MFHIIEHFPPTLTLGQDGCSETKPFSVEEWLETTLLRGGGTQDLWPKMRIPDFEKGVGQHLPPPPDFGGTPSQKQI